MGFRCIGSYLISMQNMCVISPPATLFRTARVHSARLIARFLPGILVPAAVFVGVLTYSFLPAQTYAQRLLMEDFVYPPGDSLTPYGWTSSSATGPILTSSEGLQFGMYQGSGISNSAILKSTGQDVQKEFTPDTTGRFYVWALVNVSSARSGDYFLHLQPNAGSSVYVGRTYARLASNSGLTFGVAKRGTNTVPTVVYSDSAFALGTTYLLVMKYEFRAGSTSNDEVSLHLFANGEVPLSEPAAPTVGPVADATADPALLGALALRQGDQSRAPVLTIDGIRVTRGWDACLPATLDSMVAALSVSPPGVRLSWRAWTEVSVAGYGVDRWSHADNDFLPVSPGPIPASGASGQPVEYLFLDSSAVAGESSYRLRIVTNGGEELIADSVSLDLPTDVAAAHDQNDRVHDEAGSFLQPQIQDERAGEIAHPVLVQNYPNPFNPKSIIRFISPTTEQVSVDLYDILGRHHGVLFRGVAEAGRVYEAVIDGSSLPTGVYIARLVWLGGTATRRLVVVR